MTHITQSELLRTFKGIDEKSKYQDSGIQVQGLGLHGSGFAVYEFELEVDSWIRNSGFSAAVHESHPASFSIRKP